VAHPFAMTSATNKLKTVTDLLIGIVMMGCSATEKIIVTLGSVSTGTVHVLLYVRAYA
jgi:hypothetical protein